MLKRKFVRWRNKRDRLSNGETRIHNFKWDTQWYPMNENNYDPIISHKEYLNREYGPFHEKVMS